MTDLHNDIIFDIMRNDRCRRECPPERTSLAERRVLRSPQSDVDRRNFIRSLAGGCARGKLVEPWFHFRPFLDDPKDDSYIDCALAGGASVILSRDRHFRHPAVAAFGLRVLSAGEYLNQQRLADGNQRRP